MNQWRRVAAGAPAGSDHRVGTRITFLGHATVLIEIDDLRILTDPVLGRGIGPVRRQVRDIERHLFADIDAVFISHGHLDHLDLASLRQIPGRPTILVPFGLAGTVRRAGHATVEEVEAGDLITIDRVRIEVLEARHDGRRNPFGARTESLGCLLMGTSSVYFAGDTELFPGMERLAGRVDAALLPVGGWGPTLGRGHLDPAAAAIATAVIGPAVAIPIHWGTLYPAGLRRIAGAAFDHPGQAFAAQALQRAPGVDVRVLQPGESTEILPRGRTEIDGPLRPVPGSHSKRP